MRPRTNVSLGWTEGRFFDLWMFVHLLAGVAGGFSNVWFGLSAPMVVVVGFFLMGVWEVFEALIGIDESWENRALDILVGLAGVAIALAIAAKLDHRQQAVAFGAAVLLGSLGSALGWLAHRRRTRAVRNERPDG